VLRSAAAYLASIAALLGVLILEESLGPAAILGFALVLLGSWMSTRS
jgi:drug/metabolite transporter (DMT)-like permease